MTTFNISLSEQARQFVEKQASKRGLATSSEFLEQLISQAMAREEQDHLEEQLIKGLNSGPGIEADDAYWERKQADLIRHAQNAQGGSRA